MSFLPKIAGGLLGGVAGAGPAAALGGVGGALLSGAFQHKKKVDPTNNPDYIDTPNGRVLASTYRGLGRGAQTLNP